VITVHFHVPVPPPNWDTTFDAANITEWKNGKGFELSVRNSDVPKDQQEWYVRGTVSMRLHSAVLVMRELDRLREFYTKTLQFRVTDDFGACVVSVASSAGCTQAARTSRKSQRQQGFPSNTSLGSPKPASPSVSIREA
jgi:hypothetical protein